MDVGHDTRCPWSNGMRSKKLLASVVVLPAPVRLPSQRPLAPSIASVKSGAKDTDSHMLSLNILKIYKLAYHCAVISLRPI